MNLQIENFCQQFQQLIAEAQLPVGVVRLILNSFLKDIDVMYYEQIQKEKQQGENLNES